MKLVNINNLDWFHTVMWRNALGILECQEGTRYNKGKMEEIKRIKMKLNARFIALRGYLPWQKPELWPDMGPKLNRLYYDISQSYYEQIARGEVEFVAD